MASATLIPVNEYLSTTYRPDCDYLDGEVRERPVGEELHSEIQAILARILGNSRREWGVRVLTEQRVQTSATHFRVPDLCLVSSANPRGRILTSAPLLCIEILSRADTLNELQARVNDYAAMGVAHIWAVDPWSRLAYYASPRGFVQPEDGVLGIAGTPIAINLPDLFAELDES